MAKTANINIRIDPDMKSTLDEIFSQLGITIEDAISIFLHKVIIVGRMPFDMTRPNYNVKTLAAIQEARDITSGKIQARSYSSTQEIIEELDADDTDDGRRRQLIA